MLFYSLKKQSLLRVKYYSNLHISSDKKQESLLYIQNICLFYDIQFLSFKQFVYMSNALKQVRNMLMLLKLFWFCISF